MIVWKSAEDKCILFLLFVAHLAYGVVACSLALCISVCNGLFILTVYRLSLPLTGWNGHTANVGYSPLLLDTRFLLGFCIDAVIEWPLLWCLFYGIAEICTDNLRGQTESLFWLNRLEERWTSQTQHNNWYSWSDPWLTQFLVHLKDYFVIKVKRSQIKVKIPV